MLDFRSDKPKGPPPVYAIDKANRGKATTIRQREWRLIISLPIAIAALVWMIWHLKSAWEEGASRKDPITLQTPAVAAPAATLEGADALPPQSVLDAQAPLLAKLRTTPDQMQATVGLDLDAITLAWGLAQIANDQQSPPIPGRPTAEDLINHEVRLGAPMVATGKLVDARVAAVEGGPELARLLISLDGGQQLLAVGPINVATLTAGEDVQVVGRYAGSALLPRQGGGEAVRMPLMTARAANRLSASGEDVLVEYHTGFTATPAGLYDEIDDERTVVETRPYYYQLGQVVADRAFTDPYAEAKNLNLDGNAIHQAPAAWRGKPATVRLFVFDAWEDKLVARDKPFGVQRVVRILGYKRDWSTITMENAKGQPEDRFQLVLRMFEVAAITDKPLPTKGELVTATGRFLKVRAIPVKPDPTRDRQHGIRRQNPDRVYAFLMTANDWSFVPPPTPWDFSWLTVLLLAVVVVVTVVMIIATRKDAAAASKVPLQVRKLRAQRVQLSAKAAAPPPAADPASPPPAPTAPSDQTTPPEPPAT
jgi:hypothetical protein